MIRDDLKERAAPQPPHRGSGPATRREPATTCPHSASLSHPHLLGTTPLINRERKDTAHASGCLADRLRRRLPPRWLQGSVSKVDLERWMITVHGAARSHGRAVGGAEAVVAEGGEDCTAACAAAAELIDGIRSRIRTGVSWRDVPVGYGPWGRNARAAGSPPNCTSPSSKVTSPYIIRDHGRSARGLTAVRTRAGQIRVPRGTGRSPRLVDPCRTCHLWRCASAAAAVPHHCVHHHERPQDNTAHGASHLAIRFAAGRSASANRIVLQKMRI